ncbi:MAG TPA: VOC family protein [Amycolatopsis sp.]|uniref:VOC family protein n=1 Tax=Amycolatopsis sp. TaxID=37632 RepID=UPI002B4AA195|nr:VOC family protein [Amycolatopsis sp.]HKS47004.1 VOC family protein [Amycolatopsis sp.]
MSDKLASPPRVEIGFVSRDTGLRDFLATVFRLDPLPPVELPTGSLYCMAGYETVFKVFVPNEAPEPQKRSGAFFGIEGLRFLTIRVDDVDDVVERAAASGGRVLQGPHEPVPGIRVAMLEDPDGNTLEASQRLLA